MGASCPAALWGGETEAQREQGAGAGAGEPTAALGKESCGEWVMPSEYPSFMLTPAWCWQH